MNRLWAILLMMLLPAAAIAAAGDILGLHMEGSPKARVLWVVQVLEGEKPELRYSEVFVRAEHQTTWQLISRVPGAVTSATRYRGDLALALASGEWLILNQASGRSLPGDLQLAAIAGDEDSLWAIGLTKPPTTQPTTGPTSRETAEPGLFRLERGAWTRVAGLPDGVESLRFALGLVHGAPTVAVPRGDDVLVMQLAAAEWKQLLTHPSGGLVPRRLLQEEGHTLVYMEAPGSASELLVHGAKWLDPITLPAESDVRALGTGGGQIRFIYASGKSVKERRIDSRDLSVSGEDAALQLTPPVNLQRMRDWLHWILMVIITLVMIHTYRKRDEYRKVQVDWKKVQLAPYGRRFFAGMIDLIPVLFALMYSRTNLPRIETPGDVIASSSALSVLIWGTIIFIAHTSIVEAITGRSIGKIITHLYVIRVDGKRPGVLALVVRNVLRIVDLVLWFTLILMVYLPLRQRIGDLAAGTIVVADRTEEAPGHDM